MATLQQVTEATKHDAACKLAALEAPEAPDRVHSAKGRELGAELRALVRTLDRLDAYEPPISRAGIEDALKRDIEAGRIKGVYF